MRKQLKEQMRTEIKMMRKERGRYTEYMSELRVKERKWEDKIIDLEKKIKDWIDWMKEKTEQIEEGKGWSGKRKRTTGVMKGIIEAKLMQVETRTAEKVVVIMGQGTVRKH